MSEPTTIAPYPGLEIPAGELELFRQLPKVELHDHLDGSLRASTLFELAKKLPESLPFGSPAQLESWLAANRDGSLVKYLQVFDYTTAVMQEPEAIARIARELVHDWAADGVVYGETRFAPELCTRGGHQATEAVLAALEGLSLGEKETGVPARLIVCSMRSTDNWEMNLEAALAGQKHSGPAKVVALDIAGPEIGFPATPFAQFFAAGREAGLKTTVHAGEVTDPDSIAQALFACKADRIGHGTQLYKEWDVEQKPVTEALQKTGYLEVCLTSNLQTGAIDSYSNHRAKAYWDQGIAVGFHTDNRLVSGASSTVEHWIATRYCGFSRAELAQTCAMGMARVFDSAQRQALNQSYSPVLEHWSQS